MTNFYVVNLHFTDKCNYKCEYCFSKKYKGEKELTFEDWCRVIDNIKKYFDNNHIVNGRINLVGGEPLLNKDIHEMIDYVKSVGILPSILTNGSCLNKEMIDRFKGKVKMIGISIDSLNAETNLKIGRASNHKTLDYQELVDNCKYIKSSGIVLKINTVVSKFNYMEKFSEFLNEVKPDRFKTMQVYINEGVNDDSKKDVPTTDEFMIFVNRHKQFNPVVEDNKTMDSAYLMVDAQGFLISNANNGYKPVGNALNEDFGVLVDKCNIDVDKFSLRFK